MEYLHQQECQHVDLVEHLVEPLVLNAAQIDPVAYEQIAEIDKDGDEGARQLAASGALEVSRQRGGVAMIHISVVMGGL